MDIEEWKLLSSNYALECCKTIKQYTYRGDVLLNTYMRRGYILSELTYLYNLSRRRDKS